VLIRIDVDVVHRIDGAPRFALNLPTRKAATMQKFFIVALMLLAGCNFASEQPTMNHEPLENALIIGSAESPDPVLVKVRELEERGIVKDVVVHESFPVQIRLRAPRKVIDELNRIPRSGGLR